MRLRVFYHTAAKRWMCFEHAVREAQQGHAVESEVVDPVTGVETCPDCEREREIERERFERLEGRG